MRMMIDNIIQSLIAMESVIGVNQLTINETVETMHKYQRIEKIIADWKSDGGAFEMSESYWLRLISEVVEDGNDD